MDESKSVTISIINGTPGIVFRVNTGEEYDELSADFLPRFEALTKIYADRRATINAGNDVVAKYTQQRIVNNDLGVCSKCGAPNSVSKAGKIYCSKTCWLSK